MLVSRINIFSTTTELPAWGWKYFNRIRYVVAAQISPQSSSFYVSTSSLVFAVRTFRWTRKSLPNYTRERKNCARGKKTLTQIIRGVDIFGELQKIDISRLFLYYFRRKREMTVKWWCINCLPERGLFDASSN